VNARHTGKHSRALEIACCQQSVLQSKSGPVQPLASLTCMPWSAVRECILLTFSMLFAGFVFCQPQHSAQATRDCCRPYTVRWTTPTSKQLKADTPYCSRSHVASATERPEHHTRACLARLKLICQPTVQLIAIVRIQMPSSNRQPTCVRHVKASCAWAAQTKAAAIHHHCLQA